MRNRFYRLLSCLLVFVLVIPFFCVTSHAVLPIGFAQSVLASYVASTGYKMWQDEAVGDSILQSLASLYSDTFLPQSGLDEVSLSQFALQSLLDANRIGMDNSGNVVVSKMAADVFQQFADWIQTEYSVPVGSDIPTEVLAPVASDKFSDGNGVNAVRVSCDTYAQTYNPNASGTLGYYYMSSTSIGTFPMYFRSSTSSTYFITRYGSSIYVRAVDAAGKNSTVGTASLSGGRYYQRSTYSSLSYVGRFEFTDNMTSGKSKYYDLVPVSTVYPDSQALTADGVSTPGLLVSLATDVANQAAKAGEDDAVVIGVGAQAGATAQEIADLIAQGINARTLDPSITITAEAVIDTPVQPYPDVDGLGLPTLGAALVSRFPFCVPWDFVDTLRILNADPIPPVFDVTLVPASVASRWGVTGNYTLHVDLTSAEYAKLFTALRWGTLVGFCLGLALLTKRLIWTA